MSADALDTLANQTANGVCSGSFRFAEKFPPNIAGLVLILVIVVGCLISYKDGTGSSDIWTKFVPVITGVLGFLFGKRA